MKVAERMGPVKDTVYGLTFDVISKATPDAHLAYTGNIQSILLLDDIYRYIYIFIYIYGDELIYIFILYFYTYLQQI